MIGSNKTSSCKTLWLLIVNQTNSCLIKAQNQGKVGFVVLNKWHFSSISSDANLDDQISKLVPAKASISVALASELFHYQQFLLDRQLSATEQKSYIQDQIASVLSIAVKDLLVDVEPISVSSVDKEMIGLGALAISKENLVQLSNLVTKHKLRCVRFDSIQLVLAWLVNCQYRFQHEQHWGVLEVVKQKICLLVFKGQKLLCQKSFGIAEQAQVDQGDESLLLANKVKQKVEQLLTLLNIQVAVSFFVAPECFVMLNQSQQKQNLVFKLCPQLAQQDNSKNLISDAEFYALALANKSWQLR